METVLFDKAKNSDIFITLKFGEFRELDDKNRQKTSSEQKVTLFSKLVRESSIFRGFD